MRWSPPLGFFNRIRSDHGMVDLKKGGIGPIVNLARVGALAAGSRERSTLERLAVAGKSGALLSQDGGTELVEIFEFLLHLRLRQQLASLQTNRTIDHKVQVGRFVGVGTSSFEGGIRHHSTDSRRGSSQFA